jgi:regulator of sirC expression with transglutaminase-like and TPR domain
MRHSPRTEFALAARRPDETLDLEELCLSIARIRVPDLDTATVTRDLDTLAAEVADTVPPSAPPDRLALLLGSALGGRLGFRGTPEAYGRLESSMLDQVVERRNGLPILLSTVWILIGKRLHIPIVGVGYPRHFLVCLNLPAARIYLDPFGGGRILEAGTLLEEAGGNRGVLAPVGTRPLVTRILGNIKNLAVGRSEWALGLEAVERMQVLAGDDPEQTRDRGLLCMHLGRREEALQELKRYIQKVPDAPDRTEVEQVMHALQGR